MVYYDSNFSFTVWWTFGVRHFFRIFFSSKYTKRRGSIVTLSHPMLCCLALNTVKFQY